MNILDDLDDILLADDASIEDILSKIEYGVRESLNDFNAALWYVGTYLCGREEIFEQVIEQLDTINFKNVIRDAFKQWMATFLIRRYKYERL